MNRIDSKYAVLGTVVFHPDGRSGNVFGFFENGVDIHWLASGDEKYSWADAEREELAFYEA